MPLLNFVLFLAPLPNVIPADDITQLERTVTTVIVQWKEPNYYNAPITKYTLNLCQKAEQDSCTTVNGYPVDINPPERIVNGSTVLLRYSLLLVIIDVVICSYLHRYNITGLQPFTKSPYQVSIRATNDIGSADFSPFVLIVLVDRSEIVLVSLCVSS